MIIVLNTGTPYQNFSRLIMFTERQIKDGRETSKS